MMRAKLRGGAVLAALGLMLPVSALAQKTDSTTVALWLFDEPAGLYPSAVISDASVRDNPLVLGLGGRIVSGKFGNALEVLAEPGKAERIDSPTPRKASTEGQILFGLAAPPMPAGRTVQPLTWANASFTALMTSGENHLRKEVGFVDATATQLNLGGFDWTVEFWFRPTRATNGEGVVFEIGEGPRGENDRVTRLSVGADRRSFLLVNQPAGVKLTIPTSASALSRLNDWHHFAFVYDAGTGQLKHYVDGRLQPLPEKVRLRELAKNGEPYVSLGRDASWQRPLPGMLDELRISAAQVYRSGFKAPESFARPHRAPTLPQGLPLLFSNRSTADVIALGNRKHLFIDDALVARSENVTFQVNAPSKAELVIPDIQGTFRKHVSVIEDENGVIRLYNGTDDDRLEVHAAADGVHFEKYNTGLEYKGKKNIAVPYATATGSVFLDPNAPAAERWKFVSGFHDRGTFVFTSPDGWRFKRNGTAALTMHVGSQANMFWDDQRGTYVGYHRSDCYAFANGDGDNSRKWVMTETKDLMSPWPFTPTSPEQVRAARRQMTLREPQPWFMDNGPLTPGGFCLEYPAVFGPRDLDPEGTDVYVPKAVKYPWAPDVYLAFPTMYFHYEFGPKTRTTLGEPHRNLGSGPIETQVEVSRNAVDWKRYPRPAYVGVGDHAGYNVVQAYIAHGMVRRGNEIWQYYFGTEEYHSTLAKVKPRRGVFRVVQRLDGFVSIDAPYDTTGTVVTKPLTFDGNRLLLNIDTDATGYAQVALLDEKGAPIPGFSLDDCVYINGDFVDKEVEWLGKGTDVSSLKGRTVQVLLRMRGSKLYAMQFAQR